MIKLNKNEDSWLTCFVNVNGIRTKEQKYKAIEKVISNRLFGIDRNLTVIQAILYGKWEVGEPLYYVKLINNEKGYLNISKNTGLKELDVYHESTAYKTKFTRAEVEAIDPRYLEFLEEVE
ncbi:DUF1642 domain-containing protein [Streptococcus parauberis]|uniref:DUF1642 domain-containing protein n=1 Tax=Streptococcus parauberis TaxID=1348 RepID=UPI0002E3EFF2|nr:DUF1642 domain-containing protein [Streptococcus parauberis]QBX27377.1 hypothetical protein Javan384_0042 [Streptococcus phage Javan384]UWM90537.1 DUF1642 domain-containing protein [Streptococcus parauberis]UWM91260.1 DUF1642 domain-containing protein [Streptococcus parauberis]